MDHTPLSFALHWKPDKFSPRDIQHLDYISQFTSDIQYFSSSENIVSNSLSYSSVNTLFLTAEINLDEMSKDQPSFDLNNTQQPKLIF